MKSICSSDLSPGRFKLNRIKIKITGHRVEKVYTFYSKLSLLISYSSRIRHLVANCRVYCGRLFHDTALINLSNWGERVHLPLRRVLLDWLWTRTQEVKSTQDTNWAVSKLQQTIWITRAEVYSDRLPQHSAHIRGNGISIRAKSAKKKEKERKIIWLRVANINSSK